MGTTPSKPQGFTLIELLTVIAIVAVLASLLLPVLNRARQTATTMACSNTIRHLMTASLLAAQDHDEHLPTDYEGERFVGIHYQLLHYLMDSNREEGVAEIFGCPAAPNTRQTPEWHLGMRYNYALNATLPGAQVSEIALPSHRVLILDAPPSVDRRMADQFWTEPVPYRHRGAVNIVYVDGHVAQITRAQADATGSGTITMAGVFGENRHRSGSVLHAETALRRPTDRPERWEMVTPRPAPEIRPTEPARHPKHKGSGG